MMTDIPVVKTRDMHALMKATVASHRQIHDSIHSHARQVERERAAKDAVMNGNAGLNQHMREVKP